MKNTRKPLLRWKSLAAVSFLSPSFVGLLVFAIVPIIGAFVVSLLDWDILTPPKFVGLRNYSTIWHELTHGETLRLVLINTIYFTAGTVPLAMAVSLAMALLLNRRM
ncbi:MAG: carbohydrate ABC transporter permease [Armatimonadota bacterium]